MRSGAGRAAKPLGSRTEEVPVPLSWQAAHAKQLAGDLPTGLTPAQLRAVYTAERVKLQPPRPPIARVEELSIPGCNGPVAARGYWPGDTRRARPLVVFFHGGGWVVGSLEGYDTTCRRLAIKADCVVVSVDYRLAPEHPFPAAVDDCWDAVRWCAANAAALGADPGRLVVAGDSAGGNLAAVVPLLARDAGGPAIALQVLVYPATDLTRESDSYVRHAAGYMLTAAALRWFADCYVPDRARRTDWRVSPLLAPSLCGVAPALVIAAEYDPLVDEGRAYAERLKAEGVAVEYACYPGMLHPFLTLGGVIDDAARAEDLIASRILNLG
jgi:acetyl esterase